MLKPSLLQLELVSSWISENILHSASSGTLFLQPFFLTKGPTTPCPTPLWWDLYIDPLPIFPLLILTVATAICTGTWEQFQHTVWLTAHHSCNRGSIHLLQVVFFSCVVYMYRRRKRKFKIWQQGRNQTKYRMYLFRHKDRPDGR